MNEPPEALSFLHFKMRLRPCDAAGSRRARIAMGKVAEGSKRHCFGISDALNPKNDAEETRTSVNSGYAKRVECLCDGQAEVLRARRPRKFPRSELLVLYLRCNFRTSAQPHDFVERTTGTMSWRVQLSPSKTR
jgi:hypothetical protein